MVSLELFGFTPTESRLYEVLLRLGSSTGYAVAKSSGLARANAYQALDGLVRRGAARRSATIPARYAALAPDAVVAEIERRTKRDLEALGATLRGLPRAEAAAAVDAELDEASVTEAVEQALAQVVPLLRQALLREIAGSGGGGGSGGGQ